MKRLLPKLKATLCILLIVNLNVWMSGCGQTAISMPLSGELTIDLSPGHPLAAHLTGSKFEGATALKIDAQAGTFRFIFPDDTRALSGTFTNTNGQFNVTQLSMTLGDQSVQMTLDEHKSITEITTSNGLKWERPASWPTPSVTGQTGVDAYLAANSELAEMVKDIDTQGTSTDGTDDSTSDGTQAQPTPVKGDAALGPALAILAAFGLTHAYPSFLFAGLVWILQLINLLF